MIFNFNKNGDGDPSQASSYVLADKDHKGVTRANVSVLCGDKNTFDNICNSLDFKWKYTSGVISFHKDDNPSPQQIREVLEAFEQHAFAGLEPHQYHLFAVQHDEEDGSKHVHVLVPRVELESGKSLNIAPPNWHEYYAPLRDAFNYRENWAKPDEIRRKRLIAVDYLFEEVAKKRATRKKDNAKLPENQRNYASESEKTLVKRNKTLEKIHESVVGQIENGNIKSRSDVIEHLKTLGEVTRAGENYLSVKLKDTAKAIKLKGFIYEKDFNLEQYKQIVEYQNAKQPTKSAVATPEEIEYSIKKHSEAEQLRMKRELFNQKRYKQPEPTPEYQTLFEQYLNSFMAPPTPFESVRNDKRNDSRNVAERDVSTARRRKADELARKLRELNDSITEQNRLANEREQLFNEQEQFATTAVTAAGADTFKNKFLKAVTPFLRAIRDRYAEQVTESNKQHDRENGLITNDKRHDRGTAKDSVINAFTRARGTFRSDFNAFKSAFDQSRASIEADQERNQRAVRANWRFIETTIALKERMKRNRQVLVQRYNADDQYSKHCNDQFDELIQCSQYVNQQYKNYKFEKLDTYLEKSISMLQSIVDKNKYFDLQMRCEQCTQNDCVQMRESFENDKKIVSEIQRIVNYFVNEHGLEYTDNRLAQDYISLRNEASADVINRHIQTLNNYEQKGAYRAETVEVVPEQRYEPKTAPQIQYEPPQRGGGYDFDF
ncbi:relaxase/mobilization nuclease domain-containing protein [Acinetobacter sp. MD2]|uniref:relaxase/mobilization nuclease domain-containing protein n=1 Tax=Acinetobacter sp. MD2 TaxID=2600066 RepID=UPI002D1ECA13|nr:hypothetical protein [Acinetobacter sp. MD2]MEB3768395.1 hypothetical protein [Acinetobacter sp. MD2]